MTPDLAKTTEQGEKMGTLAYDTELSEPDLHDEPGDPLPGRPRRRRLGARGAGLVALITCAAGFYAGVRVEKGDVGGSSAGATGFPSSSALPSGARSGARSGGSLPAGGAGATGAGAAGVSFGTVASVRGAYVYVKQSSGNTIRVKLDSATRITKTSSASRAAVHPGDAVVIQGAQGSGGTLSASSISDSGNGSAASGSSSASASTGSAG
jgi:hypothetical protein